MVPRPDTRQIAQVTLDSGVLASMVEQFRAAFPNEAALCLTGTVRGTVAEGEHWLIVQITGATPAESDSADAYHVYFSKPRTGCADAAGLIGAAHDHTQSGYVCTHSVPDANVLFADPRLLFTLVFCGDGFTEALFQDGRRLTVRWCGESP
jgi:hypothetical protein